MRIVKIDHEPSGQERFDLWDSADDEFVAFLLGDELIILYDSGVCNISVSASELCTTLGKGSMTKVCNDGCGFHYHELTFSELREANIRRLPTFKNALGEPAHSKADGSDWSPGEWSNAVLGELGEAANLIKKVQRGDLTIDEARPMLAKEFADVVTYMDLLAYQLRVDLGEAVISKFNEVSRRVRSPVRLHEDENSIDPRKRAQGCRCDLCGASAVGGVGGYCADCDLIQHAIDNNSVAELPQLLAMRRKRNPHAQTKLDK